MELKISGTSNCLLCYSTSLVPSPPARLLLPFRAPRPLSPSTSLQYQTRALSPLPSGATQEIFRTAVNESGFVEVGYIAKAHGLHGEICVKPRTDFPELRFGKPGRRWLRQPATSKETIKEVELLAGRENLGQKTWILRLKGVDSVDQAKQLVGSTVLVKEDDRPELEEGEFYTRDLIGMRVILKETGDCVGAVVNVFDNRGTDLLQVMLYPSVNGPDGSGEPRLLGDGTSGPLVWVPFVEAIVPDVDVVRREMKIAPPKGLLELNLHTNERSKKERRQIEWKERKRLQRRLIAAKKKLVELEQKHVFDGLRHGEKSQRSFLADQIVGVNLKLLPVALQNVEFPSKRWSSAELLDTARRGLVKSYLKVPHNFVNPSANKESLRTNLELVERGVHLLSGGKVAKMLVLKNSEEEGRGNESDVAGDTSWSASLLEKLFSDDRNFVKIEDRASVPLILVCQEEEIELMKTLFVESDYYGFDVNKVHFLEEEKLPVVSNGMEEEERHKILMKSPWEILQSPVGSGGAITSLWSSGIMQELSEMGVEYVEICSPSEKHAGASMLLVGLVSWAEAEMGVLVSETTTGAPDDALHMVVSIKSSLLNQLGKLQFEAIPALHSHVKLVDNQWIDVVPSSSNSYQLRCSLSTCFSPPNLCLLHLT